MEDSRSTMQHRQSRRQFVLGSSVAGASLAFLAARSSSQAAARLQIFEATAKGAPSGKVIIAQPSSPLTLDGGLSSNIVDRNIYLALYDTLLDWKWNGTKHTIVPRLATSYKPINDTTWEVKLRQGVTFHNGDPFTADDVKFTIERALDPKSKSSQKAFYSPIKTIDVIDGATVHITTNGPAATLPPRLTLFPMLPKSYVTQQGDAAFANHPVGTGPYAFKDYLQDSHLTLDAYAKYWGAQPAFASTVFNFIPSDATRVAALRSGSVDVVVNLPPDSVQSLKDSGSVHAAQTPVDRTMFLYIDTVHGGPLTDGRVRQALNYGIDRATIVKAILVGAGVPVASTIPPSFFGYDDSVQPYPYDPKKAKQLLAEAGYSSGFSVTLRHTNGFYPKDTEAAQAIAGQLANIGIQATDRGSEASTYFQDFLAQHTKQSSSPFIFLGSWGAPVFDAGIPWAEQFGSASPVLLWKNQQFTSLVDKGLATIDDNQRLAIYHQAFKLLYDETPAVFLWQQVDSFGISDRVSWTPRPDELVCPTDMSPK